MYITSIQFIYFDTNFTDESFSNMYHVSNIYPGEQRPEGVETAQ